MDRMRLEALVTAGRSQREIGAILGASHGSVRHWLKKYGLSTVRADGLQRQYSVLRSGELGQRPVLQCIEHGDVVFFLEGGSRYRCSACNSAAILRRKRRLKLALVAEAGGCCERCGYDRFVGALDFHHRDPVEKSFGLSRMTSFSESLVRAEAAKCMLLCANCHREIEHGDQDDQRDVRVSM